jgi:glycosyltransferase involved in cell wall biosynthesis
MRLLYAMHVNWHWIRQRPHVLAEQLAQRHTVELLHFRMFHRHHRAAESPPPFAAHELQRLPERLKRLGRPLQALNAAWLGRQVAAAARAFEPDALWVTHPDFAPALRALPGLPVVYDCMDDHAAFDEAGAAAVLEDERALLSRADLVFFSSATLADRVRSRAPVRRSEVVHNGVADSLLARPPVPPRPAAAGDGPVLGYFGTVSHWFDWPLVLRLLEALPSARLELAGPVETAVPAHPRIHHAGILPHATLAGFVEQCDVLVMPFVVNRLIEAVDPVKLYEYIAFGRPALAPRYAESERFAPWVALYRDADEALALLRPPQTPADDAGRRGFLAAQTWTARGAQIERALQALPPRPTGGGARAGAWR